MPTEALGRADRDTVHVGRQPIYSRDGSLYAYELLFRPSSAARSADIAGNGNAATTDVLLATFMGFDVHELLGGRRGFINLTRAFVVGDLPLPVEPEHAVLEVLEDIDPDEQVLAGIRRLRRSGYQIALDDFVLTHASEQLLDLADYVKLDVLSLSWEQVVETAQACIRRGVLLVAEKVEDEDTLTRCRDLGFSFFQGYHLARPVTLSATNLAPSLRTAMSILAALNDPDARIQDIVDLLQLDPALTYRLLRAVNSSAAALNRTITSLRDAVVLIGLSQLNAWVTLMALAESGVQDVTDLAEMLAMARTCQLVAQEAFPGYEDAAFVFGLLQSTAAVLGLPAAELFEQMPLAPGIMNAVDDPTSPLQLALLGAECGRDETDSPVSLPLSSGRLNQLYLSGLEWAERGVRRTHAS
ncbi:MAG: EAL and HDOD domain-containing protein [Actinomycetales bacterium]